jgi:PPOX class probable F420-dependent enzyme
VRSKLGFASPSFKVTQLPLSKSELKTLLDEPRLAHLATSSRSGKVRVSPIWYAYDNGIFYFTTRLGRLKGEHIQKNPEVALSIATDERPYRAVCAFGQARVVKENRDKWLETISFRYGKDEGKSWVASAVKQPDRVVMMLKPERVLSWHYGRGDSSRQDKGESMVTVT